MQSKLNKLFDFVIYHDNITRNSLRNIGFSKKEINDLINEGYLSFNDNKYSFVAVDELLKYGYKLTNINKGKARSCMSKCYKLDPNNKDLNLYLLRRNISLKKYHASIKHVKALLNSDDYLFSSQAKLYLILLSTLIKLPKELIDYSNALSLNDIIFEQSIPYELDRKRGMAAAIIDGHNPHALSILNDIIHDGNIEMFKAFALREMLNAAIDNEKVLNSKILKMVKNNDFTSAIVFLKKEQEKHVLTTKNKLILLLLEDALNIRKKHIVPESLIDNTNSFEVAIECANYNLALDLFKEYAAKRNIDLENDIRYHLLVYICKRINNKPKKKKETISKDTLSIFLEHLSKFDLKNAFKVIREYLTQIHKTELEHLIVNLVKISLINQDITFTEPLLVLIDIDKKDFKVDIDKYIENYYVALKNNNFAIAILYFDIIKNTKNVCREQLLNIQAFLSSNSLPANPSLETADEFYGIKDFDTLNTALFYSTESLDVVCKHNGMSDEDIGKVKLIYAREFYKQGNYAQGDLFLKAFEESPNKTYFTASIHNEIKRNRELFITQNKTDYLTLNLSLQP